MPQHSLSKFAD